MEIFNPKKPVGTIFFDITKSFEKVWHEVCIYKLIRLNIPSGFIYFIHSYLVDHTFYIRMNNPLATLHFIIFDISLCSVLVPMFFNLFFKDIPRTVRNLSCFISGRYTYLRLSTPPTVEKTPGLVHGLVQSLAR